jgi:hypothetical protein
MRTWPAALMAAIVWLVGGIVLAGTAAAAPFTIANPIEIDLIFTSPGLPDVVARATILPDTTILGDLVCLDPPSSCTDVETFVFRVSVAPESTEYLQNIAFSAPGSLISGMGYFVGEGEAPEVGAIRSGGTVANFDQAEICRGCPPGGGNFLQPGETSETLFVALAANDLKAGQTVVFIHNFSALIPIEITGTIVPITPPTPTVGVQIDIKPGSDSNPINPSGRGNLPVAILGSDTFDAMDVDATTLALGPDAAAPSHDLTKPGVFEDHLRDVNDDGFTDLVTHYQTQQTGILREDLEACITGDLLDGTPFEGCDAIRVITGTRGFRR